MPRSTFSLSRAEHGAAAENPLGLERIDHFQMTGTIDRLEPLYRRLGFARVASGRTPWGRLVHLRQSRMDVLILEADDTHRAGQYYQAHGEGVCALNFQVGNLDLALAQARQAGAKVMTEPESHRLGAGTLRFAAIKGVGDVLNYLVERSGELAAFWPDLKPDPGLPLCDPGLVRADHLTNNVGPGQLDDLVGFYERVFGFKVTRTFDIHGQLGTGLRSKVVQSANNRVIIPINEPTDAKSQIQEFVQRHKGCGVQHIAMSTNNIQEAIRILSEQGISFLKVPATYYELLPERIEKGGFKVTEDLKELERLGIQVDGDGTGYLLQIFSEDQIGPLFFEIIQRRGNMGFGEGNFQALYDSIELDQRRRGVL
ncbi:MAG: 4-hydroxyphenylpyruvate dioxygenase [Holophaga sp.]|nr:4-hydroxyphenylpyruvate dioxygenase [Holophaga sp.]